MRPVRLQLKGFTAFRDEQAIDFDGLDLFAIAGPTGSGKSSILDAMTYALFGYVERVGRQCSQLISQGQPRMAVTFEFEAGGRRHRVTRSTPARGQTKILLERLEDGEWRQAGEGADRVRESDAMIERALGLDYAAFTRSVLLPQGRFAEFLVGEAKDRRKILTELLGLDLFVRLAERVGAMKREAQARVDMHLGLLETEYAGVTLEAVELAERAAKEAAARDEALREAEAAVRAIADRWAEAARSVRDLRSCAADVGRAAEVAGSARERLEGLAGTLSDAEAVATRAAKGARSAERAAAKARTALEEAQSRWGRARDLAVLHAKAEALVQLRERAEEAAAELAGAEEALPALAQELEGADGVLAVSIADAEAAIERLAGAEAAHEEALHADLVAAVRAGVRVGEACPVCGSRVERLPKGRAAPTLDRAKRELEKARAEAARRNDALDAARAARDAAERARKEAETEAARLAKAAEKLAVEVRAAEGNLADAFGGALPDDPPSAIAERLQRLERLEEAAEEAEAAAAEAREVASAAERERDGLRASLAEVRGRLDALAVSGLLERASELAGADLEPPPLPGVTSAGDAAALVEVAGALADGLGALALGLEELAGARSAGERELLHEALEVTEGLVEEAPTLAELVEEVARTRTAAARAAATAERDAHDLRAKLENAQRIGEQVREDRARAERFGALAAELRADRIMSFLQLEALQILAAAGSEHLATLSNGRYRLRYEGDEFFVVDTWNGEEQRSARTLSGGETFLASLALALGLSEQVRSLAVTERSRLDSLFLDEGFGTLDPESLEVVVEAIEQLGGDGRMVGVITHVQELAIRVPARIEVEKSPRGSRLRLVR